MSNDVRQRSVLTLTSLGSSAVSLYEERLANLATSAVVGASWNPELHPRARNGQFIRVGSWVRGLFRVGGHEERLNGKVVAIESNKNHPSDPLIKVMTKHGELRTLASQVQESTKPKGFISKLITGDEEAARLAQYQQKMSTLEGDITFESDMPLTGMSLNGVPFSEVDFDPHTIPDKDVGEPDLGDLPPGIKQSAGVLLEEPDGRIWLYEPANHFGGYQATFSKGRIDPGDTAQQAALREAFEELGLVAEITGYVGDYRGSVTMTRFYRGRRIGGAPWKHDKEVAEVRLVSPETAGQQLHTERDAQILSDLTGDPSYVAPYIAERQKREHEAERLRVRRYWKPVMSEEEADRWVQSSAIQMPLFHGTSRESLDDIHRNGFRIGSGETTGNYGFAGRGIYLASDRSGALMYSDFGGRSGKTLEVRVNVTNPMPDSELVKLFRDPDYIEARKADTTFDAGSTYIRDYAIAHGYDAVWDRKELVVFDPKNVVVVNNELAARIAAEKKAADAAKWKGKPKESGQLSLLQRTLKDDFAPKPKKQSTTADQMLSKWKPGL